MNFTKTNYKKIIIFFAIFFSVPFLVVYIQARNENRTNFDFVITKVEKHITGHFTISGKKSTFNFYNFNSYRSDIEIGDSVSKKAYSKKMYLFRKDPVSVKYKINLELEEAGNFPIDWQ